MDPIYWDLIADEWSKRVEVVGQLIAISVTGYLVGHVVVEWLVPSIWGKDGVRGLPFVRKLSID